MRADATEPIARELSDRGLAAPSLLLLDAHRPLRPLLGLAATFLLPMARPLLGDRARRIDRALGADEEYERLVERLRREVQR